MFQGVKNYIVDMIIYTQLFNCSTTCIVSIYN